MKRIFIAAMCMLSFSTGAFAQKKLVSKVYAEARSEKPNFAVARAEIKQAMANEETKNEPKTWFAAAMLENKAFEIERNKQIINQKPNENVMYMALMSAYNYFLKTAELDQLPDSKGKVKPKYLKDVKSKLKDNHQYFINGGAYFWDKKEYKKSYDLFNAYTEIPTQGFFKAEDFKIDSNYHMINYYAALAASQIPNHQLAIKKYKALQGTGYKENEAYQYLASEYLNLKDSASFEKTLAEGAAKFPTEPYFTQTLINVYINKGDMPKAVAYLDEAISQDPKNAQLYDVKGRLYEQEGKMDEAIALYKDAIAKNPEYAAAYGNVGRIYYNRAIEENNKAATIKDNAEYNRVKTQVIEPLFKDALPFYIDAHKLAPEEREYMVALRGIYYNLDMGDEFAAIEAEMNK